MWTLIFTNLFMLALGTILYLFVRALPRVDSVEGEKTGLIERWITSDLPEKFDSAFNAFVVKFLRKLKVFVLRVDNVVGERLKRINPLENGNGKKDFKDMVEESEAAAGPENEIAKTEEIEHNNSENHSNTPGQNP